METSSSNISDTLLWLNKFIADMIMRHIVLLSLQYKLLNGVPLMCCIKRFLVDTSYDCFFRVHFISFVRTNSHLPKKLANEIFQSNFE